MTSYILTDKMIHGGAVVKITDGEFEGVEYHYGRVTLDEDVSKDRCNVNFEYDIVSGNVLNYSGFKETIFNILLELIDLQLKSEELIYAGGV